MNQQLHRQLVSGSRSGPVASVARFGLRLLSWPYAAAVTLRNICYDRGWFKSDHVAPVVISIGNITAGGTGKTPLVLWLSKMLTEKGLAFAILTRGYKSGKYRLSDEPAILAGAAGRAKVIVNPDRVAAAKEAIEKFNAEVVLMDDGFQHRRLRRDLDIVAIDATCPFGYGRLLPGGLLREPATALKRAQAVVITRCDQVDSDQVEQIKKKLLQLNPALVVATAVHKPVCAKSKAGINIELGQLKKRKVFAFCGIGNPQAFFDTLAAIGIQPVGSMVFDDHHRYSRRCIDKVVRKARQVGADMLVTTEKDATKIRTLHHQAEPELVYLVVELCLVSGSERLWSLIESAVKGKMHLA